MGFEIHIDTLAAAGLVPYVATSQPLLKVLDQSPLGPAPQIRLLEREADRPFHEAYLVANGLAFGSATADLRMPNWVLVDCVLTQTAIVGFAIARKDAPAELLEAFTSAPGFDVNTTDYLPVSGQVAGLALDGNTLVGFSLFSLRRFLPKIPALGTITKALALLVYRAQGRRFIGISHWDNKALTMHGRFGKSMWIESPTIPLHTRKSMALVYGMNVDFNPDTLHERPEAGTYDFLMRADDGAQKEKMIRRMTEGKRYVIVPPFHIVKDDTIYLPIREETLT